MYPRHHAIIAAAVTAMAAVASGVTGLAFVAWVTIGTVAGVFIDIDHVVLSMLVHGRWKEGYKWLRQPRHALLSPDALLEDIDYPKLVHHRILSHMIIFAVLVAVVPLHDLVRPAVIGLGAHILSDIAWDLWNQTYRL
jgi:hypothetical protein